MSEFGWFIIFAGLIGGGVYFLSARRKAPRGAAPGTGTKSGGGLLSLLTSLLTLQRPTTIEDESAAACAEALVKNVKPGWRTTHTFGTCDVYLTLPRTVHNVLSASQEAQAELAERVRAMVPDLYRSMLRGTLRADPIEVQGDFRILPVQGETVEARAVPRGAANPFSGRTADRLPSEEVVFPDAIVTQLLPDGIDTVPVDSKREVVARVIAGGIRFNEVTIRPGRPIIVGRGYHSELRLPERDRLSRRHLRLTLIDSGSGDVRVSIDDSSENGIWKEGVRLEARSIIGLPAELRLGPDDDVKLQLAVA